MSVGRAAITPPPQVELVNAFARPYENAVATARTCYSSRGIITPDDVARNPEQRDRIAQSIYQAGHHTTLQHAHLQFAIRNVSRQFIWTFLHSHPFYNSEQVSQRYVRVAADAVAVPPFRGEALGIYRDTVAAQIAGYDRLCRRLAPLVEAEYLARFPAQRNQPRVVYRAVAKKAQEVARYVLPVATLALPLPHDRRTHPPPLLATLPAIRRIHRNTRHRRADGRRAVAA